MPCVVEANTFIVGANAFECVGRCVWCDHGVKSRKLSMKLAVLGGKCVRVREFWRQMPCVVEANAFVCEGKCL